jgi:hypothetical protein
MVRQCSQEKRLGTCKKSANKEKGNNNRVVLDRVGSGIQTDLNKAKSESLVGRNDFRRVMAVVGAP